MLKRADNVEVGAEYRLTRDLTTRARQTLDSEEVQKLPAGTVWTRDPVAITSRSTIGSVAAVAMYKRFDRWCDRW